MFRNGNAANSAMAGNGRRGALRVSGLFSTGNNLAVAFRHFPFFFASRLHTNKARLSQACLSLHF